MISTPLFSGIADRMAAQASILKFAINSGVNTGTPYYKRVHTSVPSDGDYAVEDALIDAAHALDINVISGTMFKNVYSTMIQDLDNHILDNNAESFDSYLNISGINVHPHFEDIYYQVKNQHLDAVNVFFAEENLLVATYAATGSGTGTYTSNNPIGTGTGKVSSTNHAAARFVLVPVQNVGADIQVNLRLLREDGQSSGTLAAFDNIRITSGVTSGIQFPVNNRISGTHTYLDCNNIVAAGGLSSDNFRVYALRERDINL